MKIGYKTKKGIIYNGKVEDFLKLSKFKKLHGKINLIFTSPPFPLARPKKYGNLEGEEYVRWIGSLARELKDFLTDDGSIVIEIGNAWEKGSPVMSLLPIKALLQFLEIGDYKLCQQFIWNNTAKLPSPAQWVNVERIRVKDSFTNIWWMGKNEKPKSDNRKVLQEYSTSMKLLLKNQKYNSGSRPSEHVIGETSFLTNNAGAIPSNVISVSNTGSDLEYASYCLKHNLQIHPARMPKEIVEFFVKFLTNEGDVVLDPFAGSNTTGYVAEKLGRNWISIENDENYIKGSKGRFFNKKKKKISTFNAQPISAP